MDQPVLSRETLVAQALGNVDPPCSTTLAGSSASQSMQAAAPGPGPMAREPGTIARRESRRRSRLVGVRALGTLSA